MIVTARMTSPASKRDTQPGDERREYMQHYTCQRRRVAATTINTPNEITSSQYQTGGSVSSGCSPVPGSTPRVMRRPIEVQRGWPPSYFKQAVFCTSIGGFTSGLTLVTMTILTISPGATVPMIAVTLLPLAVTVPFVVVS